MFSVSDDFLDRPLDLNEHVIEKPSATYFARAKGDSLIELGIHDGDLLVISRSLTPKDGQVVVVALEGEMACKVLDIKAGLLRSANGAYEPVPFNTESGLDIEGVVTHALHYLPGTKR